MTYQVMLGYPNIQYHTLNLPPITIGHTYPQSLEPVISFLKIKLKWMAQSTDEKSFGTTSFGVVLNWE